MITDKVGFKAAPSYPVINKWKQENFELVGNIINRDVLLSEETILNVVNNTGLAFSSYFMLKKNITPKVLAEFLTYRHPVVDGFSARHFYAKIIMHPSVTSEILDNIYDANISDLRLLDNIAGRRKASTRVLLDMLPSAKTMEERIEKKNQLYEIKACLNRKTPPLEALYATQFILSESKRSEVWVKRLPGLVTYMKKVRNVDIDGWPLEWVQELVWGDAK